MITFHDLYSQYAADVYRFAFWLSGNVEDAEDITSESFVRAWTAKSDLQASSVKGYLLTIARHLYLKKQQNRPMRAPLDNALADTAPGPDAVAEARSELHETLQLLQALPEIDRTVLLLRAEEGLAYTEIARIVNLSLSAVKVKVHRARAKLEKMRNHSEG